MTEDPYVIVCPVCKGLIRVRRYGVRIRCPHCGSILLASSRSSIMVLRRGQVPVPPPDARPALGALGGLLLGAALGGPLGAILGLIIGGGLGSSARGPLEGEEV